MSTGGSIALAFLALLPTVLVAGRLRLARILDQLTGDQLTDATKDGS